MHLVFATSIVPDGTMTTGYEIANAAIIDALRRAGTRVTVLGFVWPGKQPADPDNTVVLGAVDVRTDNASMKQKLRWLGMAVLSGATFSSIKLRAVTPQTVRNALADIGPFDGYVLNAVQFAGAFEGLFDDKPSIFVAHNVEYRSAEENSAAARGLVSRFMFAREARLLKNIEARLCAKASFVFTLAEEDRAALGVDSPGKSAVLPLVTRATPPAQARARKTCDAALIGTWTWQPNRIGLDWFLEKVVPHLRPDFTVQIAGATPSGLTSSHPGVQFVGRVPDAVDFVRSARVIPLTSRAGTGVQLKTIETFELGLPSVATTRSVRGIGAFPSNCIIEDDAVAFARALEATVDAGQPDLNGTAFFNDQRAALDRQIRLGLEKIGKIAEQVAA